MADLNASGQRLWHYNEQIDHKSPKKNELEGPGDFHWFLVGFCKGP